MARKRGLIPPHDASDGRFQPQERDMHDAESQLSERLSLRKNTDPSSGPQAPAAAERPLSDAARRALAEASERKAVMDAKAAKLAQEREIDGRGGLDPVRYEDWEVKGIATDF